MHVVHTVAELRARLSAEPSIAFVPTMGNLHEGHVHLASMAKQHAACVVVSIFVNPLQFGKNEDLANYPRTLAADCDKLQQAGVDVVFAPTVAEMYPDFDGEQLHQSMVIQPPPIADILCGASRPGHFAGVATVVMKLFNMVFFNTAQPNIALFGKKDFQQLCVIRALVRQFNMPITIVAGETVREASGLAMSSRNGYLSEEQRVEAAQLYARLTQVVERVRAAKQAATADFVTQLASAEQEAIRLLTARGWQVDYLTVCAADTLLPAQASDVALVVLAAARLGKTRLIDNVEFTVH